MRASRSATAARSRHSALAASALARSSAVRSASLRLCLVGAGRGGRLRRPRRASRERLPSPPLSARVPPGRREGARRGSRGPLWSASMRACAASICSVTRSASALAARAWAPNWPSCSATAAIRASDSLRRSSEMSCLVRAWDSVSSAARMANDAFSTSAAASSRLALASSRAPCSCSTLGASPAPPDAVRAPSTSPRLVTAITSGWAATSERPAARSSTTATPLSAARTDCDQAVGPGHHVRRPRGSGG